MLPLWLKTRLAANRMPIGITLVAIVLGLPSLRLGVALDDRWHRAMLEKDLRWIPAARAPWDLFTFSNGTSAERGVILEKGMLPWWISEDFKLSFFRPVSSLTHALDYALWPSSTATMHFVSVLWYGALVFLTALFYRRIFQRTSVAPWIAGLAALIYAVDGTHGLPVGWLANRNAVVAAVFAVAALIAYDARRSVTTSVLLALALGSGESAAGILAYFAAHAVFLDDRPRRERARTLALPSAVALAWVIFHRVAGYGVRGSAIYLDPKHDPIGYLKNLVNLPLLAGAELGAPTPDLYPFVPLGTKVFFMTFALVAVGVALYAGRDLLRRSREARFFVAGGLLALVPSASVMVSARLLLIASIGLVGFLAMLAEEQTKAARRYVWWAIGVRLVLSPIVFTIHEHQMVITSGRIEQFASGIPREPGNENRRLVLLNAPDTAFAYYMIVNRTEDHVPTPQTMLMLAGGYRDVTVTRTDERTLVVRVERGFYRENTDLLFRSANEITPVGKRIETSDCVITATHALPDGVIDEARYELREPPESPHWLIMEWHGAALVPATIPKIGETRVLAGTPML